VGAVYSADAVDYQNNLQGNAFAEIKLPFHLNFRTNIGYSYYLETQDYFQYPYISELWWVRPIVEQAVQPKQSVPG